MAAVGSNYTLSSVYDFDDDAVKELIDRFQNLREGKDVICTYNKEESSFNLDCSDIEDGEPVFSALFKLMMEYIPHMSGNEQEAEGDPRVHCDKFARLDLDTLALDDVEDQTDSVTGDADDQGTLIPAETGPSPPVEICQTWTTSDPFFSFSDFIVYASLPQVAELTGCVLTPMEDRREIFVKSVDIALVEKAMMKLQHLERNFRRQKSAPPQLHVADGEDVTNGQLKYVPLKRLPSITFQSTLMEHGSDQAEELLHSYILCFYRYEPEQREYVVVLPVAPHPRRSIEDRTLKSWHNFVFPARGDENMNHLPVNREKSVAGTEIPEHRQIPLSKEKAQQVQNWVQTAAIPAETASEIGSAIPTEKFLDIPSKDNAPKRRAGQQRRPKLMGTSNDKKSVAPSSELAIRPGDAMKAKSDNGDLLTGNKHMQELNKMPPRKALSAIAEPVHPLSDPIIPGLRSNVETSDISKVGPQSRGTILLKKNHSHSPSNPGSSYKAGAPWTVGDEGYRPQGLNDKPSKEQGGITRTKLHGQTLIDFSEPAEQRAEGRPTTHTNMVSPGTLAITNKTSDELAELLSIDFSQHPSENTKSDSVHSPPSLIDMLPTHIGEGRNLGADRRVEPLVDQTLLDNSDDLIDFDTRTEDVKSQFDLLEPLRPSVPQTTSTAELVLTEAKAIVPRTPSKTDIASNGQKEGDESLNILQQDGEIEARRFHHTMRQKKGAPGDSNLDKNRAPYIQDVERSMLSILELGPAVNGQLNLEVEFGRILMYGHFKGMRKGVSYADWVRNCSAGRVPQASFTRMLTIAASDIELILSLMVSGGSRLFEEAPYKTQVTYEFTCLTKDGIIVVEIDEKSGALTRRRANTIGSLYSHHPRRFWDTHFTMRHSAGVDSTYTPNVQQLVDHLYIPAYSKTLDLVTKDDEEFQVQSVVLKRDVIHACVQHPGVSIRIREVQQLLLGRSASNPTVVRARVKSVADMIRDQRFWYEVSLFSPEAQRRFAENQHLEHGDDASWTAEGLVTDDVVAELAIVASEIVKRIDKVGGGNGGEGDTSGDGGMIDEFW